jgi:hypothetical protein
VIRREHLAAIVEANPPHRTGAALAASQVKRGESVRVIGLGTLACVCPTGILGQSSYRLTLTTEESTPAKLRGTWQAAKELYGAGYEDVRHLAQALGHPVEVSAPTKEPHASDCACNGRGAPCGKANVPAALITTVQP